MFLFGLTACFDPYVLNILRVFLKAVGSRDKTSLSSKNNFIGTINIFCKTTVIDAVHIYALINKIKTIT